MRNSVLGKKVKKKVFSPIWLNMMETEGDKMHYIKINTFLIKTKLKLKVSAHLRVDFLKFF